MALADSYSALLRRQQVPQQRVHHHDQVPLSGPGGPAQECDHTVVLQAARCGAASVAHRCITTRHVMVSKPATGESGNHDPCLMPAVRSSASVCACNIQWSLTNLAELLNYEILTRRPEEYPVWRAQRHQRCGPGAGEGARTRPAFQQHHRHQGRRRFAAAAVAAEDHTHVRRS